MKEKYGNIRRVFIEGEKPQVYDKATRTAYMDFQSDKQTRTETVKGKETTVEVEGFSGFTASVDGLLDYGHLKSQLIEAGYPQKEEHALAFNTIDALLKKVDGETLTEAEQADIEAYKEFSEYRSLCANCAKAILAQVFNS